MDNWIQRIDFGHPALMAALFLGASLLMIWRLECLTERGFGGTVLGTLIMPYCSGIGNLIFAYLMTKESGGGKEVVINCLVNNATNLTLLIGLPALIWGMPLAESLANQKKKPNRKELRILRLNRLDLLLTLLAVFFFTGGVWILGRDGELSRHDGWMLIGLFLFWQCFHVFEIQKNNVRENKPRDWLFFLDAALLLAGAWMVYFSTETLVGRLSETKSGFLSAGNLGWLTGWLMVLPNAMLAMFYGWKNRGDIVYASQIGDGHVCIPLCLGIYAAFVPIRMPDFFDVGAAVIGVAIAAHAVIILCFGRVPKWFGCLLVGAYGYFVYAGLAG